MLWCDTIDNFVQDESRCSVGVSKYRSAANIRVLAVARVLWDPTITETSRIRPLLTGPGFSLTQLGIGSGRNRLSTDSSSLAAWPEIDMPGEPVGYAFSTVDSEGEDHTQQDQLRPKKK